MDDRTRCTLCNALMPAARSILGKALVGATFTAIGVAKGNGPVEKLAITLAGIGLGHVADMLIAELAKPLCGDCRAHATTT